MAAPPGQFIAMESKYLNALKGTVSEHKTLDWKLNETKSINQSILMEGVPPSSPDGGGGHHYLVPTRGGVPGEFTHFLSFLVSAVTHLNPHRYMSHSLCTDNLPITC